MSMRTKVLGSVAALLAGVVAFFFLAQTNPTSAAPMARLADGHYAMGVMIDGEGPFDFVVDTGAQGSVMAPALAQRLKLATMGSAHIRATSGTGAGGMVLLKSYSSPLFSRVGTMMVVLPAGGLVQDGVIGMDLFASRRLELDFAQAAVRADPSGPTPTGFSAIPATITQGSFIITDAVLDGVHVKAMIDTGARRTIGNLPLRKALGLGDGDPRLSPAAAIGGATADKTPALKAQARLLMLGSQRFAAPVITFSDVPVLEPLGLADSPAIIIGLDLLTQMKAVAIDYPRSELQLKP